MLNIKVYLIIVLIIFVLISAVLNSYTNYSMAYALDFEFTSDNEQQLNDFLKVKDVATRKNAVSAAKFWSTNKYLVLAPPLLNVVAGLMGAYLLMF